MPSRISRRHFATSLLLASLAPSLAADRTRELNLSIDAASFEASEADIRAVLLSAASELWRHCEHAKFEFGFRIYRNEKYPITHFEREDGRIVIGLSTQKTFWSQYAYQFAHEFCHALMDHSSDWRRRWHETEEANQWFEEVLCETGSLFALRAMGKSWETRPPYANWASFGKRHIAYAQERIDDPRHQLTAGTPFAEWFKATEPVQRKKWTRENNTIIAIRLLPLFEKEPAGWDTLPALNIGKRERQKPLAQLFQEWSDAALPGQREFIAKVAAVFS